MNFLTCRINVEILEDYTMAHDVFISYSRADKDVAGMICSALEENNISYWIDKQMISGGDNFANEIVPAIKNSKITVFVSSSDSNNSLYTVKEIVIAFNNSKHIIPFRVQNISFADKLEFFLCDLSWIDAFENLEERISDLVLSIKKVLGDTSPLVKSSLAVKPEMVSAPVVEKPKSVDLNGFTDELELELSYNTGYEAMLRFDLDTAFKHLFPCALENYKDSQAQIGCILSRSTRVFILSDECIEIAKEGCERGNSFAQYVVGRLYSVKYLDDDAALGYMKLSAEQNDPYGLFALARVYDLGLGVRRDKTKYLTLINKAVYLKNPTALIHYSRDNVFGWVSDINTKKAIELINSVIELNYAPAYDVMGDYYWQGLGVEQDFDKAEEFYKKAVSLGYYESYDSLSKMYMYHPNTYELKSPELGLEYLYKGASYNEANSLFSLAFAYYNGKQGVNQDMKNAEKWFKRAADMGNYDAYYMLGDIYYNGLSGCQSNEKAWGYLKKGHKMVSGMCEYMLGIMCENGDAQGGESEIDCVKYYERCLGLGATGSGVLAAYKLFDIFRSKALTPNYVVFKTEVEVQCIKNGNPELKELDYSWVEKDDKRALGYIEAVAKAEDLKSMYFYGVLLTDTDSVYSNEFYGKQLLEKAYNKGHNPSAAKLAYIYYDGIGTVVDKVKAKEYYKIAIDNDVQEAIVPYYSCLIDDADYEDPNDEVVELVNKAAELGIKQAVWDRAIFTHYGAFGFKVDIPKAIDMHIESVCLGVKAAAEELGDIYYNGEGIPQNYKEALRWYLQAQDLGQEGLDDKIKEIRAKLLG